MLIIPGRYAGEDGECTVLMPAVDGETGEKTVIYRKSDGRLYTMSAERWAGLYRCAEDTALGQFLENGTEAELARRFTALFSGRSEVCSVHWRTALAYEGYNYLCENAGKAAGCMFGTDNCKNCRSGRFTPYTETVAAAHLGGEMTVGVYPVFGAGLCRFAVIEELAAAEAKALSAVCRSAEIPAYCEGFAGGYRLWFFFSRPVAAADARSLCAAVISRAMEESAEVSFGLYEKIVPRHALLAEGSFGRPVILPLGRFRRSESAFVDGELRPLPEGKAAIFAFRSITAGYLADRLRALGAVGTGLPRRELPRGLDLPSGLKVRLEGGIGLPERGLSPASLAALKRRASFANPERPLEEFADPEPAVSVCFREESKTLWLPRGLWSELEPHLAAAEYTAVNKRRAGEGFYFPLEAELKGEQLAAARALLARSEGVLLGATGSGKTEVVARVIAELRSRTLILTADERTRRRWADNVYRLLAVDAGKDGGRIEVRLVTDEKIKDKYGLVILADCSRVPLDAAVFSRLSALSPAAFYGITADDRRRDGLWDYVRFLCGDVVYEL